MKRPASPPADPSKGTMFAAAALEVDVVAADPVAEDPEDFAPVPDSQQVSTTLHSYQVSKIYQ